MEIMETKKGQNIKNIFYNCEKCDYHSNKIYHYKRHLKSQKHINAHMETQKVHNVPKIKKYECIKCNKNFNTNSGLWKHKKKCDNKQCDNKQCDNKQCDMNDINYNKIISIEDDDNINYKELVIKLLFDNQEIIKENQIMQKENQKLMTTITGIIPQIGNNNNNTTNNVKNKFNINVFLNEKCKDAISIDQFIDTIEVSMKNLLTTRDKGLGEGLSSIIIDNMNKLSIYERPMHCTDKKRETMYIKNQEWTKDDKLEQVDKLLKRVENKQLKNIKKWTDINPNFMESEKLQEEYIKLINSCTTSIDECRGKTIKKVCDKVYIEKE